MIPHDRAEQPGVDKWRAFAAVGLAFVTIVLSSTMVFVLLSAIAEDFGVTLRSVGWVVIVESLIISALLLPLGGVADAVGRRRVHVAGLAVFGVGSILTGLAPTFGVLIAARIVMAVGSALSQSVVTGILVAAFPPEERGLAMGSQTTAVSVGAASGPLIGGLALQVTVWETLFIVMAVPVGAALVTALWFLPDDRPPPGSERRPVDGVGGVLSGLAVVVSVVTISNPFALDWLSLPMIGGLALAVVLTAAFVAWELRQRSPMLEVRLFTRRVFRSAVVVRLFGFSGPAATTLLLPIYLLSLRGTADGVAGAVLFLIAVGTGTAAQVGGRLMDRTGPRPPSMVGLGLQVVVLVLLAVVGQETPLPIVAALALASGLGTSLWNVPNNAATMGSVPRSDYAVVGAFTNVNRTMGNAFGQALATAIVVGVMASRRLDVPLDQIDRVAGADEAFLAGWRAALLAAAALSAIGFAAASRLPGGPLAAEPAPLGPSRRP